MSLSLENMSLVVDTMNNETTDFKSIISQLLINGDIVYEDLYDVIRNGVDVVINDVAIPKALYNEYSSLNKCGQVIESIKRIRVQFSLGLKEAKDINDVIKDRIRDKE
jgi:hypothetical protein